MSGPWEATLDTTGPCNGDVIVRTPKGSLVAVIYAVHPRDDAATMRRAVAFCKAASPQWCSTCGVDTEAGDECENCRAFWAAAEIPA